MEGGGGRSGPFPPSPPAHPSCDRSRAVLTDRAGSFGDRDPPGGRGNYTQNSHCEWLVRPDSGGRGNKSQGFITLTFDSFATECGYDYVFVYDGESSSSKLLGSFSGADASSAPFSVTGRSGALSVLFFSDTNYALGGFSARYQWSECPSAGCSGRGTCDEERGECECQSLWGGEDCSLEGCPGDCGEMKGRGR